MTQEIQFKKCLSCGHKGAGIFTQNYVEHCPICRRAQFCPIDAPIYRIQEFGHTRRWGYEALWTVFWYLFFIFAVGFVLIKIQGGL